MSLDESHLTHGTTSPFLPGTKIQFAWDSTSLGLIKTCPRLYQYTMIDGWGHRGESIHLKFGIEYHHALEFYASRGLFERVDAMLDAMIADVCVSVMSAFEPASFYFV